MERTLQHEALLSGASLEMTQIILQVKTEAANWQVQTQPWGTLWRPNVFFCEAAKLIFCSPDGPAPSDWDVTANVGLVR